MDGSIISVRGLRNRFGDQLVHDNLDLDVRYGEILGVVGGSGTGKSVLMRSIIGLQTPEVGEITVFDTSMLGKEEDEATDVRRRGIRRVDAAASTGCGFRGSASQASTSS